MVRTEGAVENRVAAEGRRGEPFASLCDGDDDAIASGLKDRLLRYFVASGQRPAKCAFPLETWACDVVGLKLRPEDAICVVSLTKWDLAPGFGFTSSD
jgi:hypothetical protein